ncbi:MAG: acyltransferase [Bacteroidota bacterium]
MNKSAEIHESAYIDDRAKIGSGTKVWHFVHVMSGAVIGSNCSLGQNVFIGANVRIGDGVRIQNNVSVFDGVMIESGVFVGPSAVFTNVLYPRSFVSQKKSFVKTIVREGASIGANATVICGYEIGRYAMVGAGSVVTHDVKDHELVLGNPSRHLGWVSKHGLRLRLIDDLGICPSTGERYKLVEGALKKWEP